MNSVFTLTFILLLALKLTGVATISWWIVFAPLIVGFILFFAILMVAAVANK